MRHDFQPFSGTHTYLDGTGIRTISNKVQENGGSSTGRRVNNERSSSIVVRYSDSACFLLIYLATLITGQAFKACCHRMKFMKNDFQPFSVISHLASPYRLSAIDLPRPLIFKKHGTHIRFLNTNPMP